MTLSASDPRPPAPGPRPPLPAQVLGFLATGLAGSILFARGGFALGIALFISSVLALRFPSSIWDAPERPEPSRRDTWLGLAAIAVIAAFFRTYRLVPPGLWGDDALNGLLALDVLDGKITSPYQLVDHAFSRFHALSNYLIAASFHVFGPSLASLRLPGVLLNFACVLLLYGICAPLFGARVALCGASFFATSPMQISHAKILIQGMAGEFFVLLAMYFLVRGLCGQRRWLTALAGPPLGLALCTYHATKLAPLIPLLLIAALLLAERKDRVARLAWSAVALLLMIAVAAPGYVIYLDEPKALTGRIAGTSIFSVMQGMQSFGPLWGSFLRTLGAFHYQQGPVLYHWFGIGTDPALDAIVGFLCLHGAIESLLRWKEPRHFLLLGWFAVGLLAGIFSTEAPRIYRVLLATPPLFVWAGMPVARLLALPSAATRARAAALGVASLLLVAVPLVDFNYYFYRVYTHPGHQWLQGGRLVDMARTLARMGPGWTGHLITSGFDSKQETLRFLQRIWNIEMRDVTSLAEVMPVRGDAGALLIIDPSAQAVVPALEEYYSAGAIVRRRPATRSWWLDRLLPLAAATEPGPMATYLPLSGRARGAARGVRALYLGGDGEPLGDGVWPQLLTPTEPLPAELASRRRIVLTGALYAPTTGSYRFRLASGEGVSFGIDGHALLSPQQREASTHLVAGMHRLSTAIEAPDTRVEIHWQPPSGEPWQQPAGDLGPIPPDALYRDGQVRGWLAEYRGESARETRLEPLPWHQFFRGRFEGRYGVRWRGRLLVPEDGRTLRIRNRGKLTATVDGEPFDTKEPLPAGEHEVDIVLEELEGAVLFEMRWQADGGRLEPVARTAYLPPWG